MTSFSAIAIPAPPDCTDIPVTGIPSTLFSYVVKSNYGIQKFAGLCPLRYHSNAMFDNLQVNNSIFSSAIYSGLGCFSSVCAPFKFFDIKHPKKEGYRLRYSCIEGPENAVFYRGKLSESNTIELPDHWDGLIDPETITVNLTPHKIFQELYVKSIEWGRRIVIANNSSGPIDCSYVVCAERIDGPKLIVEYEGTTGNDYPIKYEEKNSIKEQYDIESLVVPEDSLIDGQES